MVISLVEYGLNRSRSFDLNDLNHPKSIISPTAITNPKHPQGHKSKRFILHLAKIIWFSYFGVSHSNQMTQIGHIFNENSVINIIFCRNIYLSYLLLQYFINCIVNY